MFQKDIKLSESQLSQWQLKYIWLACGILRVRVSPSGPLCDFHTFWIIQLTVNNAHLSLARMWLLKKSEQIKNWLRCWSGSTGDMHLFMRHYSSGTITFCHLSCVKNALCARQGAALWISSLLMLKATRHSHWPCVVFICSHKKSAAQNIFGARICFEDNGAKWMRARECDTRPSVIHPSESATAWCLLEGRKRVRNNINMRISNDIAAHDRSVTHRGKSEFMKCTPFRESLSLWWCLCFTFMCIEVFCSHPHLITFFAFMEL